jgi:hypothetical protein
MSQHLFDEWMVDGCASLPDASSYAICEIEPRLSHNQEAVLVGTIRLLGRELERIRSVPSVLVFQTLVFKTHWGASPTSFCTPHHLPKPRNSMSRSIAQCRIGNTCKRN